ncbi:unnamed protein product [Musa acuminata subsp. malaccensis]|uniref:(wild Malaysian banana) hypothetical protein n=1 Tax=Musa acuminata subsp. malaccensis TaxID=214687 RepID=A0A8D7FAW1_MUSAM|nr:unnamed protein product [Musa acuminata subsp. malaccensis]
MELRDCEELLKVLDSCLSRIKWRLRPLARRRLETDILALCTRLRPVILVDYDGIMPKLQENLSALLFLAQKESNDLQYLRIMILDDMAYIIHVKELAEHVLSSLGSEQQLTLLDLEQYPMKILSPREENEVASDFVLIQKLLSSAFPVEVEKGHMPSVLPSLGKPGVETSHLNAVGLSNLNGHSAPQPADVIDLSSFLQDVRVTLPSLNGWLLGYPVTYLFSKEHAEKASYNLSTKSLRIFKIFICRKTSGSQLYENELMRQVFFCLNLNFTVPCDMSQRLDKEPWIEAFLVRLSEKLRRCEQIWASMRLEMEVKESHQQSVVL